MIYRCYICMMSIKCYGCAHWAPCGRPMELLADSRITALQNSLVAVEQNAKRENLTLVQEIQSAQAKVVCLGKQVSLYESAQIAAQNALVAADQARSAEVDKRSDHYGEGLKA